MFTEFTSEFTAEPRIIPCHVPLTLKTADQRGVVLTGAPGQNKSYLSSTCLEGDASEGSGMGFSLLKARL